MKRLAAILILVPALHAQRFVKTVPTVADLALVNIYDVHTNVFVTGTSIANDGGQALYTYIVDSVIATNADLSVIKPVNYDGRWIRQLGNGTYPGVSSAPSGTITGALTNGFAVISTGTTNIGTSSVSATTLGYLDIGSSLTNLLAGKESALIFNSNQLTNDTEVRIISGVITTNQTLKGTTVIPTNSQVDYLQLGSATKNFTFGTFAWGGLTSPYINLVIPNSGTGTSRGGMSVGSLSSWLNRYTGASDTVFTTGQYSYANDSFVADGYGSAQAGRFTTSSLTQTRGFFFLPALPGVATGIPVQPGGGTERAVYIDTANTNFYFYNGGWNRVANYSDVTVAAGTAGASAFLARQIPSGLRLSAGGYLQFPSNIPYQGLNTNDLVINMIIGSDDWDTVGSIFATGLTNATEPYLNFSITNGNLVTSYHNSSTNKSTTVIIDPALTAGYTYPMSIRFHVFGGFTNAHTQLTIPGHSTNIVYFDQSFATNIFVGDTPTILDSGHSEVWLNAYSVSTNAAQGDYREYFDHGYVAGTPITDLDLRFVEPGKTTTLYDRFGNMDLTLSDTNIVSQSRRLEFFYARRLESDSLTVNGIPITGNSGQGGVYYLTNTISAPVGNSAGAAYNPLYQFTLPANFFTATTKGESLDFRMQGAFGTTDTDSELQISISGQPIFGTGAMGAIGSASNWALEGTFMDADGTTSSTNQVAMFSLTIGNGIENQVGNAQAFNLDETAAMPVIIYGRSTTANMVTVKLLKVTHIFPE